MIENDWTRANLLGKVRSYSEINYEAENRFGKIEKGKWKSEYQSKYDDKGNQIEEKEYNSDGSLYYKRTYKYEFDKQGNWIKRIESKNEIPQFVHERAYEYYD